MVTDMKLEFLPLRQQFICNQPWPDLPGTAAPASKSPSAFKRLLHRSNIRKKLDIPRLAIL